ncbi:MAG TPA: hypothetical protein VKX28_28480 [Xanthobacteraceae bacterium]|nr:hypothetical protein [Xanthobacteraceae bacterium]
MIPSLQRALELHRRGDLAAADGAHRVSLQRTPRDVAALRLLGSDQGATRPIERGASPAAAGAVEAEPNSVPGLPVSRLRCGSFFRQPDWRWLIEREDCPWYASARLFRQSTSGDWPPVIARVRRELANFVAGAKASG